MMLCGGLMQSKIELNKFFTKITIPNKIVLTKMDSLRS